MAMAAWPASGSRLWGGGWLPTSRHSQAQLALEMSGRDGKEAVGVDAGRRIPECAGSKKKVDEVKEKHGCMMESGGDGGSQVFEANKVMSMYVKCGRMLDAQHVFDTMPTRNAVSWNMMMMGYAKKEESVVALEMYAGMHEEGVVPSGRTFVGALKACCSLARVEERSVVGGEYVASGCLEKSRAIHSRIVKSEVSWDVYVGTSLVDTYLKCGSMGDAWDVFRRFGGRDVVCWTAMILGCCEEGELALRLYAEMQWEGVVPDAQTFVGALKACSRLAAVEEGEVVDGEVVKTGCLEKGRSIHAQIVKRGFGWNPFVGNALMDMYVKCGSMADGCHVFEMLPRRDVVSWNAMIMGYAEKRDGDVALQLYVQMQLQGVVPDERTFVGTLKACSSSSIEKVRAIHCRIVKSGFAWDVFVGTTLLDAYARCGSMADAQHVFEMLPHRDVVSWNAMILGHVDKQESEVVLQLYARMHEQGIAPDDRSYVGALKASSSLVALEKGTSIHSQVVKAGFESNSFVGNTLLDMYAKCGRMTDAQLVFDRLPHRNVVSWTAMMSGYADIGDSEAVFRLYAQMEEQGGLSPDSWTFVSILKACGNAAALETGKDIHSRISKAELGTSATMATALVDMYSKCGSMVDAQQVFDAVSSTRDLKTWSALIAGYACQGDADLVFRSLDRMKQEGFRPDAVTFLSVLTLCSHAGLVEAGHKYFDAMTKEHGLAPTIHHYTCMVDLLGRAGLLDEAAAMVEQMPHEPNLVLWTAFLAACRKFQDVQLASLAFHRAVQLDAGHAAAYALMSNMYADAHMWEERDHIQAMRRRACAGNNKRWSGRSWWTDTTGMVHTFVVADAKHPRTTDIRAKLTDLAASLKVHGYMPRLDCVLWDISDDDKEHALCGHSEKLAIAHALLNTPPGTTIRIVKNLRVCDDCHTATALISKLEQRHIICRDASRFHHFKDGKCSCGGYW